MKLKDILKFVMCNFLLCIVIIIGIYIILFKKKLLEYGIVFIGVVEKYLV